MTDKQQVHVITRDSLLDGSLQRLVAASIPGAWTAEQRQRSLDAILALRPGVGEGIWLFAYGSLIWNPAIHFCECRPVRVHGWHRAFCLSTAAGRGTPENPGLVLGLDRGGACSGCAFRIAEADVRQELSLLWSREMISGSYIPRWVRLRALDGAPIDRAITFTIDRQRNTYAGDISEAETIRRLATARGALGSAAEYLFQTRDGLKQMGLRDRSIDRLAAKVSAYVNG